MGKIFALACLMMLPIQAMAVNAIIDCAGTTLATTYSTSAPNLPTSLKSFTVPPRPSIAVINNTSVRVCINVVTVSAVVAPTAGDNHEHCVAAGMFAFYDMIDFQSGLGNVYVRADGASCTSGKIDIDVW